MSSSHTIKADSFKVSTDGQTNVLEISKGSESILKGDWKVDGSLKVEQGTDPKSPVTVSHLGEKLSSLRATVDNEVADTYVNKTEWNSKNEDLKGYTDNSVTGLSDSLPSTYVTLGTAQRITGLKTFEGGFNIYYADKNTNKLSWKYDSDGIKILGGENFSQNVSFKLEPYQLKIGTITVWQLKSLGGDINQSITLPSKSGVVALVSDVDAVSDSLEILDITVGEISNNLDALSLVVADAKSDIRDLGDELNVVKSDVGDRYTKQEIDAALAVKADKAEVEAEATARESADDKAAIERESARLREQWKSQTYAEFRFVNTSTTTTQYDLFKVTANGAWWIDFGDGNDAQLQTELVSTPVLDFGSDTERFVRFYGAITKIELADSRTGVGGIRMSNIVIDSEFLSSVSNLFKFMIADDSIVEIVARNASGLLSDGWRVPTIGSARIFAENVRVQNSYKTLVFENTTGNFNIASLGTVSGQKTIFFSANTGFSAIVSNFQIPENGLLIIDCPNLSSTTTDFRFIFKVHESATVLIRLPSLSNAPNFFSGYSANLFSLKQMLPTLESLPVWEDGKTHNFGIHCRYTETTETFTATDADGVEYSLENCPSFDEDDAEQTFRKAYVLTIAKKGWTILLKNKNA